MPFLREAKTRSPRPPAAVPEELPKMNAEKPNPFEPNKRIVSRRRFLKTTAAGLGAASLPLGCGKDDAGKTPPPQSVSGDTPETADVKFGIIALTDCSPIVIAHEKGFFKKYGINSTITKPANWAA